MGESLLFGKGLVMVKCLGMLDACVKTSHKGKLLKYGYQAINNNFVGLSTLCLAEIRAIRSLPICQPGQFADSTPIMAMPKFVPTKNCSVRKQEKAYRKEWRKIVLAAHYEWLQEKLQAQAGKLSGIDIIDLTGQPLDDEEKIIEVRAECWV